MAASRGVWRSGEPRGTHPCLLVTVHLELRVGGPGPGGICVSWHLSGLSPGGLEGAFGGSRSGGALGLGVPPPGFRLHAAGQASRPGREPGNLGLELPLQDKRAAGRPLRPPRPGLAPQPLRALCSLCALCSQSAARAGLHLTCREVPTSAALGYLEGSFFVSSFPLLVSKFIGRPDAQCLPCIVGHVTVASVQGEVWEELTAHPKSQNVHLVVHHPGSGEQRESGKDASTRAQLPLPHGDHLQG